MTTPPTLSDEELAHIIDPDIRKEIGDPVPVALAATIVYIPLMILGGALAWFWQESLPGNLDPLVLGTGVLHGFGAGCILVVLTWLTGARVRALRLLKEEFRSTLGDISSLQILGLALLSGVAEELLFRGTLQPWLGLSWSAIIFGLLHIVPNVVFLPWTIFALITGFIFGWLYEKCDTLAAPITAHITVNWLNLWLIVCGRRMFNRDS
jgi:membrane protease YdiL (CAAX protease family)